MHACDASNQLSTSQNHTTTSEDVVDEVQNNEDPVSIFAISYPHKLERGMCIRNTDFSNYTKYGHQSDLEGKTRCPPDRQCDAPFVGIRGADNAFVDPHPVFCLSTKSVLEDRGFITYQLEKTADAVKPVPTERLATMNISDCSLSSDRYRFCTQTAARMIKQNKMDKPMMMP